MSKKNSTVSLFEVRKIFFLQNLGLIQELRKNIFLQNSIYVLRPYRRIFWSFFIPTHFRQASTSRLLPERDSEELTKFAGIYSIKSSK